MTTNSFGVAGGPVQQHPVAGQEVFKAVPDWVSQLSDVDGVHQAKAFQLVHAQIPVKHLEENRSLFRPTSQLFLTAAPEQSFHQEEKYLTLVYIRTCCIC